MNTNLQNKVINPRQLGLVGVIGALILGVGILLLVMAIAITDLGYQLGPVVLNVATATVYGIIAVPLGLLVTVVSIRRLSQATT